MKAWLSWLGPVAIWLLGLVLCGLTIARVPFAADMSAFLPRSANPAQQVLVDQLKDGPVSRIVLLAIEGAPADRLTALSKALAARLRVNPAIAVINNGEDLGQVADRAYLWDNRYLLSPQMTPARFTAEGLKAALNDDLARLATPMGILLKRTLPADPTGEMLALIDLLASGNRPAMRDGVWVSVDSERAIILAQGRAAAFDIDAQAAILHAIETDFAAAKSGLEGAQKARLVATGPPVFAVMSRAQIRGDVTRLSLIATGLVAAILLLAYRSPILLVLCLVPVASGILAGIAAVGLGFGYVHAITLGFGVTLMGEAVDYAIYLFSRTEPGTRPAQTLPRLWPTLRLGLLTSLVGFAAMLYSGFPGFVQLGLLTMTGLATAALVTRFILPRLVPKGFAGVSLSGVEPALARTLGMAGYLRIPLAVLVAAALAALVLHKGSYWQDELSSMNPVPQSQIAQDRALRASLNAPDVRYMAIVLAVDEEAALGTSADLGAALTPLVPQGALSGFDSPSALLPPKAVQEKRRAAIPAPAMLRANLEAALQGLPFRADSFAPFLAAAEKARGAPLLTRQSLAGTSLGLKLDSSLIRHGNSAIAILQLHGVKDPAALSALLRERAMPGVSLLDLKAESDMLLSRYLSEAQMLSLAGSVAIMFLLAIALRRIDRIVRVIAPLAAAVIVTAALLTLGDHRLSVFNLFGLLLVVAVGSNYCLFFERGAEAPEGGARLLASLLLANLCTVIGFGILSFSGVPVLHGIGMTVAIGTVFSLIFGAVLATRSAR